MSMDVKILNKMLANQIQQHILKYQSQHYQVGFDSGLQECLNICKLTNVIHHIDKRKNKKHDPFNGC